MKYHRQYVKSPSVSSASGGALVVPKRRSDTRPERVREMYQDYIEGMTLAEVGRAHGLTRKRVRQLFALEQLPRRRPGWQHRWARRTAAGP